MADLPTGTVTLLFTDIEGSTRLLDELGERYAGVLAEHRRALREAFRARGGVEVDTQGDSFFYAFPSAMAAVAAAREAQAALSDGPLSVRIGVHTGEPAVTEEGYVGTDVHRAARIMGAGHGGQVLLSQTTRDLLDPSADVRNLGEHRLKDVGPQRLYQLGAANFPPLRSLNASNLPLPATPLLGRKKELADLLGLLRRDGARLVTLTGPGGIGKTRFAIEVGTELVEHFTHGVWFVDLSAVRDPALVLPTVAETLGAKVELGEHVADKELLLLLDNFEQVAHAAADVANTLSACPNLQLIVTSREALHLGAEREYGLRPLAESPAVELFRQRADAADADFDASYDELIEICDRLDRLPLAIELAAARVKVLGPAQLRARLEQRLPLLTSRSRDLPERQRTLRATIEWSYELLSEKEQFLFCRLGVFAGGASLQAAEEVCEADLDVLGSLIDKSLVRRRGERITMLETIREFTAELLDPDTHRRHADFFLALAESANLAADAEGPQRNELVLAERDNMRAALAWALGHDRELGLRLVVALENLWATTAPREGHVWATALLDGADEVADLLRARALRVLGGMSNVAGNFDRADEVWEESLQLFRGLNDEKGVAILLHRLATTAAARREWPRAQALAEESLEGHRRSGFRKGEAQALSILANVARAEGDLQRALELFEEGARIAEAVGFRWWLAGVLANIAAVSLELEDVETARRRALEALSISHAISDAPGVTYELALLSELSALDGDSRRAGILWGAAEIERERAPSARWLHATVEPERVLRNADEEFERGRLEGRTLSLDEAVTRAQVDPDA